MELRAGYKKTDIGLVPNDWNIVSVGNITKFHKQGYYTTEQYKGDGEYFLLRGTDMQNPRIDLSTTPRINANQRDYEAYKVLIGDFLFVRSGAIGRYGIANENTPKSIFGSYLINFRFVQDLDSSFFGYFYQSQLAISQVNAITQGGGNVNINAENIKALRIPLPPTKSEQTAIATALSDADALISSLEKLIDKKRKIKQGVMQRLLTGDKRLPGFSGDWEEKKLGDIGEFKNGINKGEEDFGFGYPFVNLLDVFGRKKVKSGSLSGLVNSSIAERNTYNLKKGDVLFIRSSVKPEGVGLTSIIDDDLFETVFSGFLIRFRDFGKLDLGYKVYCFHEEGFRRRVIESSTVSANTNINQNSLRKLQILLPPTIEEQKSVGAIISALDDEIVALELKLYKYEKIKSGMMQNLLTGKIRLVKKDELNAV